MNNRVVQILVMVLLVIVLGVGIWVGYSFGTYSGRNGAINDIRSEANYIRDQARSGDLQAKALCKAYRDFSPQLSGDALLRSFRPLQDC